MMRNLFYKWFPLWALLVVVVLFSVWGMFWVWQKPQNVERFEARMQAMGAVSLPKYELRGFPSRYDFRLPSARIETPYGVLEFGAFEVLNYPQNPELAVFGFADAIEVKNGEDVVTLRGQPLRASVHFLENSRLDRITLDGQDVVMSGVFEGQRFEIEAPNWLWAYDQSREERFAMRITQEGETTTWLGETPSDVMAKLLDHYLQ